MIKRNNGEIFILSLKTNKQQTGKEVTKKSLANMKVKRNLVQLTLCSKLTRFPSVGVMLRNKRTIKHNWTLPADMKAQ